MNRRLTASARAARLMSSRRLYRAAIVLVVSGMPLFWLLAPSALAQPAPQPPSFATPAEPRTHDGELGEQLLEADPVTMDAPDPSFELSQIDGRLWELRHEARHKHWLAPTVLVVAGYGTALVGLTAAVVTFGFAEEIRHRELDDRVQDRLDVNNDGRVDRDDEQSFRSMARTFTAVGGIGMAIGIVGSVLLAKTLREPAGDAREVRGLKQRRRELLRQMEYTGDLAGGRLSLTLRGRF